MAKAVVRLSDWRGDHPYADDADLADQLGDLLRKRLALAPGEGRGGPLVHSGAGVEAAEEEPRNAAVAPGSRS
jgi:hypothetical protein